ncbi:MAG TPA: glycosyltransferase family 39 protein [Patescibacteria group bacterium]|nr:glycosyltransferase family 39 protein [Patescibacteria group bacterium]
MITKYLKENKYLILMIVLSSVLVFFGLGNKTLTLDEVATINISSNWDKMVNILYYQEANMWLYYILIHLILFFGKTEFLVRFLSAFSAVLTVPVFYGLVDNLVGKRIAKIATPLFIFNFYFVFYAQTARSYSFTLFLSSLALYFFIRLVKGKSKLNIFVYSILSSMMVYSYLLAALPIASEYLSILILNKREKLKEIVGAGLFTFILLIPLFLSKAIHSDVIDWLQKPPLVHLPFGFIMLGSDSIFVSFIAATVISIYLWSKRNILIKKSFERFVLVLLLLLTIFPIVFTYLFSLFVKPLYQPQAFNTSLPAFTILLAMAIDNLKTYGKFVYKSIFFLILLFMGLRLFTWFFGPNYLYINNVVVDNVNSRDWKAAAKYIKENKRSKQVVVFYSYYIHYPIDYYFNQIPGQNPNEVEISTAPYAIGGGTKLPEPNIKLLDSFANKYEEVDLVQSYNDLDWLGRKQQSEQIEKEIKKNFILVSDKKMNQIDIEIFKNKKS